MQIKSIYRGARISAFKAREVTREIQGLPVAAALDVLAFTPRKAAGLIAKTLKSAVANAENNNNLRADRLVVQEATVGEGPTLRGRYQTKARGSAGPIRKRTSHIRIILTDEIEIKPRRQPKKSSAKKGARPAAKKTAPAPASEPAAVAAPAPAPAAAPETPAAPSAPAPEQPTTQE